MGAVCLWQSPKEGGLASDSIILIFRGLFTNSNRHCYKTKYEATARSMWSQGGNCTVTRALSKQAGGRLRISH